MISGKCFESSFLITFFPLSLSHKRKGCFKNLNANSSITAFAICVLGPASMNLVSLFGRVTSTLFSDAKAPALSICILDKALVDKLFLLMHHFFRNNRRY